MDSYFVILVQLNTNRDVVSSIFRAAIMVNCVTAIAWAADSSRLFGVISGVVLRAPYYLGCFRTKTWELSTGTPQPTKGPLSAGQTLQVFMSLHDIVIPGKSSLN